MAASNPELEADCIRRILAGERHLFHDLIRPCERGVYLMLFGLLRNEAEAEDAAQDTAIKVFQNLQNFRGESQFRTWVLSIARNEGLGRLRKQASRREDSLEADTDEQTGDYTPAILTSWREVPSEALERRNWARFFAKQSENCRRFTVTLSFSETSKRWTCAKLPSRLASRKGL
jgi:RNA polymerase sigma-70 factor (ECF subfamily)